MDTIKKFERNQRIKRYTAIGVPVAIVVIAVIVYFTLFTLFTLEVHDLLITPQSATVGSPVTISAQIENKGITGRDYTAELIINGELIDKKTVSIDAKELATVSFDYTPDSKGTYGVSLGQAEATFTASEGLLPTWYNSDKWVYQTDIGDGKYQISYEVLGKTAYENTDAYLLRLIGAIPSGPFDRGTSFVDATSLSTIEEERLGKLNDVYIYQKTKTTSRITNGNRWPLVVGNNWTEHITSDISSKNGFSLSQHKIEATHTFTVENIEDLSTSLGVFRCFKIVERDEQSAVVRNSWYSDSIKRDVRYELFIDGLPYSFDIIAYKVAASAPQIIPNINIEEFTEYRNTDEGYILYYQKDWEMATSPDDSSVNIFTSAGDNGINFASARIKVITVEGVLELDVVYEDIIKETIQNDPYFVLIDSAKSTAELPWYNLIWSSKIGDVDTIGKTILLVADQKLFIITGWVQENHQKTYLPQLEQLINSIGIIAPVANP